MRKRHKLQNMVLLCFSALALVLILIISFVVGTQYVDKEMENCKNTAYAYTKSAAELIDGDKIAYYLESTDLTVTVVHPIPKDRWVSWVDPRSMEISPRRRSPRHGKASDILPRLYPLIPMLSNPRLKFRVLLLEVHDFRLLSGRKKNSRRGGERYERIPISLIEDIQLNSPKDFERFLPQALPSPFTVKDFSRATKIVGRDAYSAVRVLVALGLIAPAPNTGRSMAFTVRSEN